MRRWPAGVAQASGLTVVTAAAAVPFLAVGAAQLAADPPLPLLLGAAAALLGLVRLRVAGHLRVSAADLAHAALIVLVAPGAAALVAGAAAAVSAVTGRRRAERVVYTTVATSVSVGAAAAARAFLGGALPPIPGDGALVAAALPAALLYLGLDLAQLRLRVWFTAADGSPSRAPDAWLSLVTGRAILVLAAVILASLAAEHAALVVASLPVLVLAVAGIGSRLRAEAQARRLATLVGVSSALGATLEPDDVFRAVHLQVRAIMDADAFVIALADRRRHVLRYRFLADAEQVYAPIETPFAETIAGRVVETGRPIFMHDASRERAAMGLGVRRTFGTEEERSLIAAPLRVRGEVVGAVIAQSVRPAAYAKGDLELLGAIANEAAVAIERADLYARATSLSHQVFELHRIGLELADHRDLAGLCHSLGAAVVDVVGASSAAVYLDDGDAFRFGGGTTDSPPGGITLLRKEPQPGHLAFDLEQLGEYADSAMLPEASRAVVEAAGCRALLTHPLRAAGQSVGALFVGWSEPHVLTDDERELIGLLAGIGASQIRSIGLYRELDDAYVSTVAALTATIEARDGYGADHQRSVAADVIALGERLGLPEATIRDLRYAAHFHALGKIAVPASVIGKQGPLTPEEHELIREHPLLGARILESIPFLRGVVPIVKHANERWDGSGYPSGLRANDIPFAARLLHIALSYEAMIVDRPYRKALPPEAALAELRVLAGVRYDPVLVIEFTRMIEARGAVAAAEEHLAAGTSRELAVLAQITPEFHQLLDVQTLLERILAILQQHLPNAYFTILLEDEATLDLVVRAVRGPRTALVSPGRLAHGRGISGWVLAQREVAVVDDVRADPRYVGDQSIRSELAVPLVSNGRAIGVIVVDHPAVGAFSSRDVTLLQTVGAQIAAAVEVAELHERLKRAANTDALTGIHNYGYFFQRLEEEVARAERRSTPLAVAFFDIDGLKRVNDTHGHLAGNAVLRTLGQAIEAQVRAEDVPARYGGDEFAIVMPDTPREEAEKVVQRLMESLDRTEVVLESGGRIPMPSRSWGVAAFPLDGRDARALVENADTRSYARKRSRG